MTETIEDRIIRHESYREFPYQDTLGNWTVGIGKLITQDQAQNQYASGISYVAAVQLLEQDIVDVKQACAIAFEWLLGLDELRQEIIWELAFQLGVSGVAKFVNMIAAIRIQDWAKAAYEMVNSQWHTETPARCNELSQMMLTGLTSPPA